MKNKVVVTGAPGFLGTKLVNALLEKDRQVTCIVHPSLRGKLESIFPGQGSLTVKYKSILAPLAEIAGIIEGAETVFNCAGMQHPRHTKEIYDVNARGPENLLRACLHARVNNFVHVSSSTICGSNANALPLTEHSSSSGHTHYTKSKIIGDKLLLKLSSQRTRVIILLPAVFYGSPPSENLSTLLSLLKSGHKLPLIGPEGTIRSYVNINTVIDSIMAAETRGSSGESYLISDKLPLTTKQFYESLARGLGVTANFWILPTIVARAAEKMAWLSGKINFHLKLFTVLGEFGRPHVVDPAKAEKQLGISMPDSPVSGLEEMAKSWLRGI